jgi:thiol peroxidase
MLRIMLDDVNKNSFQWEKIAAVLLILIVANSGCKEHTMQERKDVITMKGKPLTLLGKEVKVGDSAPDFEVVANDMSVVKFSSYRGKICIICSVPSLDTSVCDIETRRFNEEAGKLGSDVTVLTISMDLPFAQKRWCGAAGVNNVQTLSDYREASFGEAYGILIKELRLLARAVFVVDKEGIIRYIQIVKEVASEPNYEAALNAVKGLEK